MPASEERQLIGRLLAAIWVAMALFGFLRALRAVNPLPQDASLLRAMSIACLALGLGAICIPWRRLPRQVFVVLLSIVSIQIGVLSYADGPAHGDLTLLFTFVLVSAAYFFSWKVVVGQLALVALVLGSRLVMFGTEAIPSSELIRLGMLVPALALIAWLVHYLRRGVTDQEARLERVDQLLKQPLDDVFFPDDERTSVQSDQTAGGAELPAEASMPRAA